MCDEELGFVYSGIKLQVVGWFYLVSEMCEWYVVIFFFGVWFGIFWLSVVWVWVCVKLILLLVCVYEWEGCVRRLDGLVSFKCFGVWQEDCWVVVMILWEDLWDIGFMVYCGCSVGGGVV